MVPIVLLLQVAICAILMCSYFILNVGLLFPFTGIQTKRITCFAIFEAFHIVSLLHSERHCQLPPCLNSITLICFNLFSLTCPL